MEIDGNRREQCPDGQQRPRVFVRSFYSVDGPKPTKDARVTLSGKVFFLPVVYFANPWHVFGSVVVPRAPFDSPGRIPNVLPAVNVPGGGLDNVRVQ